MSTIEVTPVEQNALYDLEDLLPDINKPFSDEDMPALAELGLNVEGATRALLADDDIVNSNNFLLDLRQKVERGREATMRQVRVALNVFREKKLGIKGTSKYDATLDPSFDRACRCRECGAGFDNVAELVHHRVDEHDFEPEWGSKEQAMVAPVEVLEGAEETGLDLSDVPDGYYGVPLPNSYSSSTWTFIRIKRLRRNKNFRNRKYRYGKVLTGAEFVPAGTIEVAEVSSDSERLSGEQRGSQVPGELYRGEFEQHLELIKQSPQTFAKLFAEQIERCGRCGKRLTDDISRSDCFGPECINHVSDHFFSSWSGKYTEEAMTTCPVVGCKLKDGKEVDGEPDTFECGKGHRWVFKKRNRKPVPAGASA